MVALGVMSGDQKSNHNYLARNCGCVNLVPIHQVDAIHWIRENFL